MKAMVIRGFGGPEVFEEAELDTPRAGPGQVLIRVAASSVNPIDCKIRSGAAAALAAEFPAVLHGDVAGTVEAVGPGVKDLQLGQQVYACAGGVKGQGGALAEFMLADADLVAPQPQTLSPRQAAVLPLVAITAWEALLERARVRPGRHVLVHGGAGGVGHLAIQLARLAGAVVYTTVSSDAKAQVAHQLGADVVINYRQTPVEEYVRLHTRGEGFDVVFDTVGGACLTGSFQAARPGGTVVTIAGRSTQDLAALHMRGLSLHVVFMLLPMLTGRDRHRQGRILRDLAGLVDLGRLRPVIDSEVFRLADVAKAHARLESGRAIGKIAIDVAG